VNRAPASKQTAKRRSHRILPGRKIGFVLSFLKLLPIAARRNPEKTANLSRFRSRRSLCGIDPTQNCQNPAP